MVSSPGPLGEVRCDISNTIHRISNAELEALDILRLVFFFVGGGGGTKFEVS